MTIPAPSETTVDTRALLGLATPAEPHDWGTIRAFQLRAGRQFALFHLAAHLIGAAMVAIVLAGAVPLWQLGAWGAVTAAVATAVAFRRLASRNTTDSAATPTDIRDTYLEGLALGAVWIVPPLAFDVESGAGAVFGLWMVLSVLMTASAIALAPLAMSTLIFLGLAGAAVAVRLLLMHAFVMSGATLLFVGLLMLACLMRARSLVAVRAGQIALAERDETVSLLLREFEDTGSDWLWETDAARRVVKASPRFAYACGYDPVAINGMPFLQVLAGATWEAGNFAAGLRDLAEKLKARDSFRDLRLPVTVNGEERWWEIAASPRFDERGAFVGFRGVGSDVTEQRASADKINRMARFDTLTGLPNRLAINEAMSRAMAEAERWSTRCAFMMIDLDRFKAVNDTLGHPIGDRLLGRVSERLSQMMTPNELVGRLGGDEFAVVVRDASDTAAVEKFARTIIETLSRPYEVDQHTLYIGASVGVATGPRDGRTAEMLVRSADLALYRSKDSGGGSFHLYEPQLHVQAEERRVLEMELRRALERGQMHLHYQPVVDAGTGKLTGFEALLRWIHPELGNISPLKFIGLAEDTRLIAPIGEWVLRTACEEAARWPSEIRIAVNVSPEQLHNPNFVTVVASALAQSGLPAQRLELEVTEGVFLREGTGAVQVLERVLDLGVRLSLDDFGTGYSSLGYLSRTRFSSIKIDRSFVQGASKGSREAIAIIRAVVALAQSLGMATTAEGVETESEHLMIQDFGCTKVQGYYFGRPLPVAEARALATQPRWKEAAAA
ncbi:MAG: putative bifunctional diguanylate cyclase/phosphodiesterase [Janthinobacterium lividum]